MNTLKIAPLILAAAACATTPPSRPSENARSFCTDLARRSDVRDVLEDTSIVSRSIRFKLGEVLVDAICRYHFPNDGKGSRRLIKIDFFETRKDGHRNEYYDHMTPAVLELQNDLALEVFEGGAPDGIVDTVRIGALNALESEASYDNYRAASGRGEAPSAEHQSRWDTLIAAAREQLRHNNLLAE